MTEQSIFAKIDGEITAYNQAVAKGAEEIQAILHSLETDHTALLERAKQLGAFANSVRDAAPAPRTTLRRVMFAVKDGAEGVSA